MVHLYVERVANIYIEFYTQLYSSPQLYRGVFFKFFIASFSSLFWFYGLQLCFGLLSWLSSPSLHMQLAAVLNKKL